MKLVPLKCPQCDGDIELLSATVGRCKTCGSGFMVEEETAKRKSSSTSSKPKRPSYYNDFPGYGEGFDPESFFTTFGASDDVKDLTDVFVGPTLQPFHVDRAGDYFKIEVGEVVYLVIDTSLLNSGKVGLACCQSGIYMKDQGGDRRFMSWERFGQTRKGYIRLTDSRDLMLGKNKFILVNSDGRIMEAMFKEIWNRLQKAEPEKQDA